MKATEQKPYKISVSEVACCIASASIRKKLATKNDCKLETALIRKRKNVERERVCVCEGKRRSREFAVENRKK